MKDKKKLWVLATKKYMGRRNYLMLKNKEGITYSSPFQKNAIKFASKEEAVKHLKELNYTTYFPTKLIDNVSSLPGYDYGYKAGLKDAQKKLLDNTQFLLKSMFVR